MAKTAESSIFLRSFSPKNQIIPIFQSFLKYIASKNQKEFMQDLKKVYQAINKETATYALDSLEENGVINTL